MKLPVKLKSNKKNYYKYLDSYRFIAVFLVILFHWLPGYFADVELGKIGVDMFFVLSGFLITENLLIQKLTLNGVKDSPTVFKNFYARRSLRIFPIYYLVILLFFFVGGNVITDHPFWFIFYVQNYLFIKLQSWPGMFSHLWSLAVEEQFYLFWPTVILLIPYKYLGYLLVSLIAFSLIYLSFNGGNGFKVFSLQACISTLSIGGLLAFIKNYLPSHFNKLRFDVPIFIFLFLTLIIGVIENYGIVFIQVVIAFTAFLFIKILLTRQSRMLNILFANPITSFLGKISYGLYLYHNFIPWLLRNLNGSERLIVLQGWNIISESKNGILILFLQFILLMVVATISWFLIEKPINSLKAYFSYSHG